MRRSAALHEVSRVRIVIVFDRRSSNGAIDLTANERFLETGVVHRRKCQFNVGVSRAEGLDERRQKAVGSGSDKTDSQYPALA